MHTQNSVRISWRSLKNLKVGNATIRAQHHYLCNIIHSYEEHVQYIFAKLSIQKWLEKAFVVHSLGNSLTGPFAKYWPLANISLIRKTISLHWFLACAYILSKNCTNKQAHLLLSNRNGLLGSNKWTVNRCHIMIYLSYIVL